jgi:hypothetical protein
MRTDVTSWRLAVFIIEIYIYSYIYVLFEGGKGFKEVNIIPPETKKEKAMKYRIPGSTVTSHGIEKKTQTGKITL